MENNIALAFLYTLLSVMCSMFAAILNNVELVTRIAVGIIGMASGFMAIRYHFYATIEKKESIKKLKSENK